MFFFLQMIYVHITLRCHFILWLFCAWWFLGLTFCFLHCHFLLATCVFGMFHTMHTYVPWECFYGLPIKILWTSCTNPTLIPIPSVDNLHLFVCQYILIIPTNYAPVGTHCGAVFIPNMRQFLPYINDIITAGFL